MCRSKDIYLRLLLIKHFPVVDKKWLNICTKWFSAYKSTIYKECVMNDQLTKLRS